MAQLSAQGQVASGGATSVIFSTSPAPHALGDKGRDGEGNEYVFCHFTATTYYGCVVAISPIYKATPLLGTANIATRVGIVCSGTPSTDNHPVSGDRGWVQIYGVHAAAQTGVVSDGGVSATAGGKYYVIPQTSVGTPTGTFALVAQGTNPTSTANTSTEGNIIINMWVVDFAEVSDLTTYPGVSSGAGSSGPVSRDILNDTSGANTSAFIGQTYAVFLNYPYVTGIAQALTNAVSDF